MKILFLCTLFFTPLAFGQTDEQIDCMVKEAYAELSEGMLPHEKAFLKEELQSQADAKKEVIKRNLAAEKLSE